MKITVKEFSANGDATLSLVSIDGKFECFGLEDEYRAVKVAGETRIPRGTYNVGVRTVGGFNGRYTKRFEDYSGFHKGMLQVMDVPGFEYILIHIGNDDRDTAGCLLVGEVADGFSHTIGKSKVGYIALYEKVIDSALSGDLTVEYI